MADGSDQVFHSRLVRVQQIADSWVIAAAGVVPQELQLFFKSATLPDQISLGENLSILDQRTIGEAPVLRCQQLDSAQPISVSIAGQSHQIEPQEPEQGLFSGLNTIVAIRNEESAKITGDWLRYHVANHGLQAALILSRAQPGTDDRYTRRLKNLVRDIEGLKRLVVLEFDAPLGKPDLPAEAHPFNVASAPGKDRMDVPPPDPWRSPLGEVAIYELLRALYLGSARAVANIDVYDLLCQTDGPNIFDQANGAASGCIQLLGKPAYPWRVRKEQAAEFGDHICVQFDAEDMRKRWCVAPQICGDDAIWRLVRVVGTNPPERTTARFHRFMALRHPNTSMSKIVPKSSLIEDPELLSLATGYFDAKPVKMPRERLSKTVGESAKTTVVTTMKNEGPFVLDWIAYHRVIGVSDFLIYTNDCTDGTDTLLDVLQSKGLVHHRQNPFRSSGLKPQHAAFQAAEKEDIVKNADWIICMDVDEYINIHAGDGRLKDLFAAVGGANMIALTWRLFGNGDTHLYEDHPVCERFTHCAPELIRKPHQAWGFKTLFRNIGIFRKLGVHRPKGLKSQLWEDINWVNGSGAPMPKSMFRNGWRSTLSSFGYDLVTLNHYAVRSAESFLVKRDRGRVNHVDRDQGLAYWFRMNNNAEQDHSIQRMMPALQKERAALLADPEIAKAHATTVENHRQKIDQLRQQESYATLYDVLTSSRMQGLSRLHAGFGANVFLAGPDVIPDDIAATPPGQDFFFTIERKETKH